MSLIVVFTSILVGIATLIFAGKLYIRRLFTYWERKKVPFVTPEESKKHSHLFFQLATKQIYDQYVGKDVMVGTYQLFWPAVLVLDPDLAKQILISDFPTFHSHGTYYNERDDPLSAHLFALDGPKWKSLRTKLTPTFTSGKMKAMFQTVLRISEEMQSHLEPIAAKGETIDIKDVLARFTTDVIGSCAFGIDCNSIKNPEAEFRVRGNGLFIPSKRVLMKIIFAMTFKTFSRFAGIRLTDPETAKFFIGAVRDAVEYRKQNNIVKNDFLQLVIDLYNKGGIDGLSTIEEVAGQAFLFFVAGFETSSTTMGFGLYELARNPDIQEKLREEINEVVQRYDGKVTYEGIQEMKYLEKVFSETLRMYPPAGNLIRIADKDYSVKGTNYVIEKGTMVTIPAFSMQRDPQYFPDPEKFDPERFSEENIAQRQSYVYMPFGEGPRICIGARFGRMQAQLGFIQVLRKYRVSMSEKTPKVVEFEANAKVPQLKGGFMLKLTKV